MPGPPPGTDIGTIGNPLASQIEILTYRFDGPRWINFMSFELNQVSVDWSVYYLDPRSDSMIALHDRTGRRVEGSIPGFVPLNRTLGFPVGAPSVNAAGASAEEQYIDYSFDLPAIQTSQIEINIERRLPTADGVYKPSAYSVRVRNAEFRLNATRGHDMPPVRFEDVRVTTPMGHVEKIKVADWPAYRAIDGNLDSSWKCEPQPASWAVVPYYMDIRDPVTGEGRLIDQLWIDPLFTGPTMNVYYSTDDAAATDFQISRTEAEFYDEGPTETEVITGVGLDFNGDDQEVWLDGTLLRMTPHEPWVSGIIYLPDYAVELNDGTQKWLLRFELFNGERIIMGFDSGTGQFRLNYSVDGYLVDADPPTSFQSGSVLAVAVGYEPAQVEDEDGELIDAGLWHLWVVDVNDLESAVHAQAYGSPLDDTPLYRLYVGSDVGPNENAEGFLRNLWLRQEPFDAQVARGFAANADDFVHARGSVFDRSRGDWCALLLAPLVENFKCLVGPGPEIYEGKEWTPVFRDYRLRRGIVQLPPTFAKYIKLEFSDLTCRPYPIWVEGTRHVMRDYPQWVHQWYSTVADQIDVPYGEIDRATTNSGPRFKGIGGSDFLPTERHVNFFAEQGQRAPKGTVRVVDPTNVRYEAPTTYQKRFFRTIRHVYDIREVVVQTQQAFFVGLNEVIPMKINYADRVDTAEYPETFGSLDLLNFDKMVEP